MGMSPRLLRPRASSLTPAPTGIPASLLIRFNGADASTAFTDSSPNNLTVTANGDAQISTAQSKWGGSSGYFDGDGDYLAVAPAPSLYIGAGDFTVEMWAYLTDQSLAYPALLSNVEDYTGSVFAIMWDSTYGAEQLRVETNTGAIQGSTIGVEMWHHIAVVRISGIMTLYVDGVADGSMEWPDDFDLALGGNLIIGHHWDAGPYPGNPPVSEFSGYIDDLRIVNGLAVYTGPFTPPSGPLPAYANSVA